MQKKIKTIFLVYFYKIFKNNRKFYFHNYSYKYYYHWYNNTWENERSIEVPLILKFLKDNPRKKVLEVGNVLSHYFPTNHNIIDKYERGPVVIDQDVIKFNPKNKYDLIISISTLEHIGWDEKSSNPNKILKAISNLKRILKQNGQIIFTLPIGYNSFVDKLITNQKILFSKLFYFEKFSKKNDWRETKNDKIINRRYNYPFPGANAIVLGIINKQ